MRPCVESATKVFLLLCKQDAIYGRECRAAANAMLKVLQRMQKIHVRFFFLLL